MSTRWISGVLILFFLCLLFLIKQKKDSSWHNEELAVGIFSLGLPYASMNKDGEFVGFDVELSHCIAQKLNKKIIFSDMQGDFLIPALQTEHIDFIGCSFVMTQKNLNKINIIDIFGKPNTELTFVFWRNVPNGICTIEDLKKESVRKPIALRAETVWQDVLEERGITNVMALEQYNDLVLPLKYGQAFTIVVGPRHALALQKQYPEIKILKVKLDKPWAEGVGIALKKGNTELKEKLEKVIAELKRDGTIKKLITKWFGEGANDC